MTKYTYELKSDLNIVDRVDENGNKISIPINEANSDYKDYLEHEAKTK